MPYSYLPHYKSPTKIPTSDRFDSPAKNKSDQNPPTTKQNPRKMRAVPSHHRLLPLPPPPPATKLLPSAATSTSGAITDATTPSFSSSCAAAPTAIELPPADSPTAAYWDYQFLFASQRAESAEPVLLRVVAGSVPADFPAGTYYLAGPGLFADDHGSTVHPLDGHGYLRAFSFSGDGEVFYSARYVETEAKREEREEETGRWRFTHRGPFSVLRGGKRVGNVKVMKNVANTGVLSWGGRLFCLWEGGHPYEVDRGSLDTVGPVDLVGLEQPDGDRTARRSRWWKMGSGVRGGRGPAGLVVDVAAHFLKPVLHGERSMGNRTKVLYFARSIHHPSRESTVGSTTCARFEICEIGYPAVASHEGRRTLLPPKRSNLYPPKQPNLLSWS